MSDAPTIKAQTIYLQMRPCEPVGTREGEIGVRLTRDDAKGLYRSLKLLVGEPQLDPQEKIIVLAALGYAADNLDSRTTSRVLRHIIDKLKSAW